MRLPRCWRSLLRPDVNCRDTAVGERSPCDRIDGLAREVRGGHADRAAGSDERDLGSARGGKEVVEKVGDAAVKLADRFAAGVPLVDARPAASPVGSALRRDLARDASLVCAEVSFAECRCQPDPEPHRLGDRLRRFDRSPQICGEQRADRPSCQLSGEQARPPARGRRRTVARPRSPESSRRDSSSSRRGG
jgi:hypothetical protein